jgi:hypothetical protein
MGRIEGDGGGGERWRGGIEETGIIFQHSVAYAARLSEATTPCRQQSSRPALAYQEIKNQEINTWFTSSEMSFQKA